MTEKKCNCKDCEAMKILERLQFNLKKGGRVSEALDAAIEDKVYINFSGL
jgi:hypothetical protein